MVTHGLSSFLKVVYPTKFHKVFGPTKILLRIAVEAGLHSSCGGQGRAALVR